jgi:hypothetical protein
MATEHPGVTVLEAPPSDLFVEPTGWGAPDRKTIHVNVGPTGLFYSVTHADGDVDDFVTIHAPGGRASFADLLEQVAIFLDQIAASGYTNRPPRGSQLENLRGVGTSLFERLVPGALCEQIGSWPDASWITIATNESWVPWELLYDPIGNGFLGERFMVFRLPRVLRSTQGIGPRIASGGTKLETVQVQKVLNVIGGDLPLGPAQICERLFERIGGRGVTVRLLKEVYLTDLVRETADADLIHFTCHGHREPFLRLQISANADDPTVDLLVTAIRLPTFAIKRGSLIFANSCGSGAARLQFGEFLSFGWEFYLKGSSVFIGTLGTVRSDSAIAFAAAFYDALIDGARGDICAAYRQAKSVVRASGASHLLYCLYGNPRRFPRFNV